MEPSIITHDEYKEYKSRLEGVDKGGNDGADIYDFQAYCQHLESKYGYPVNGLIADYESTIPS